MSDLSIRIEGVAGRITLTRPEALNALTWDMCLAIEAAIDSWRDDDAVALVILDAVGDKAFCAGGDIAEMYRSGTAGDFDYGRRFWRDEYRLNAKLAAYPKPIVAFLNGFTMGGGVGLGGHASDRIVGESAQISMPECAIGFVPDVGGSHILAQTPGGVGAYLGLTAYRMSGADAIFAGFADHYIPEARWSEVKSALTEQGDTNALMQHATPAPESALAVIQPALQRFFASADLGEVIAALRADTSEFAEKTLKTLNRNAPLAMAVTLEMLDRLRATNASLPEALEQEYRVSHRIMEHGDFLEGIRAAIIDKDRNPKWRHLLNDVPAEDIAAMLAPLGPEALVITPHAQT